MKMNHNAIFHKGNWTRKSLLFIKFLLFQPKDIIHFCLQMSRQAKRQCNRRRKSAFFDKADRLTGDAYTFRQFNLRKPVACPQFFYTIFKHNGVLSIWYWLIILFIMYSIINVMSRILVLLS